MTIENDSTTTVDMLRHGECEGGRIFRGSTDVNLLPSGFDQMQAACSAVTQPWDLIISSPLRRCRHFALSLAEKKSTELHIDERLHEINFGDWEGRMIDTIWQEDYATINAWINDPESNTPPNGEALSDVYKRMSDIYHDICEQHRGKKVLLVAHGGVIRVMLTYILNMPLASANSFDVPYACLSRFAIYHGIKSSSVKLLAHNYHLGHNS